MTVQSNKARFITEKGASAICLKRQLQQNSVCSPSGWVSNEKEVSSHPGARGASSPKNHPGLKMLDDKLQRDLCNS